jgi:hypothetical protein
LVDIDINRYLTAHADTIIGDVARTSHTDLEKLLPSHPDVSRELAKLIVHKKEGIPETVLQIDKAHNELAVAAMEAFWLGCLARQKEKRLIDHEHPERGTVYPLGFSDIFKTVICNAFEAGRVVGETRQ